MEIVDIVDENDQVVGNISKDIAHKKGLLHRTAIAEVINSKGEWLLVKQAGHKQDAGQYVNPVGGHVSSGETEDEALKREAAEEVGLKDFKFKLIGKAIFNRKVIGRKENHYFIVYEIYSDGNIRLNDESVDYKWFSRGEIVVLIKENPKMFGDGFYFVWNNFYKSYFA